MKTYFLTPPRDRKPRLRPIGSAGHADDRQSPDGGWKPLSKNQKTRLSILAREAAIAQRISLAKTDLDAWRHEESIRACGLRISEASQQHWPDLKAAFELLAGKPEKAFETQFREGDNKRRVALHKLTGALQSKGLHPSYAASICHAQFKCAIEDATAKQLWCLFFTVSNRKPNQ